MKDSAKCPAGEGFKKCWEADMTSPQRREWRGLCKGTALSHETEGHRSQTAEGSSPRLFIHNKDKEIKAGWKKRGGQTELRKKTRRRKTLQKGPA